MTQQQMPREFYQLLNELQAVDFVLVELTLYLDTHPGDSQALSQFGQFQRRKRILMQQYENTLGQLQEYGNSPAGQKWTWNDSPWPWQV